MWKVPQDWLPEGFELWEDVDNAFLYFCGKEVAIFSKNAIREKILAEVRNRLKGAGSP